MVKYIFILFFGFFNFNISKAQININEILESAILEHYLDYEEKEEKLTFIYDTILGINDFNIMELIKDVPISTMSRNEYIQLKPRKRRKIGDIIYIYKIQVKGDISSYYVNGAQPLPKRKDGGLFVFSEIKIDYKYDCELGTWKKHEVKVIH